MVKQNINNSVAQTDQVEALSVGPSKKYSKFECFQQIFIIFFVFSLVGHYLEVVWAWIRFFAVGNHWYPRIADIIPLAAPYGLGAVALVLFVWPMMKKRKLHPGLVFVISGFVTGAVEFLCALLLVILYGRNYFWDYSKNAFNLFGFVCLQGVTLFAISSMVFLYYIYPVYEKYYEKLNKKQISVLFWVLFVAYSVNLTLVCIREFF